MTICKVERKLGTLKIKFIIARLSEPGELIQDFTGNRLVS